MISQMITVTFRSFLFVHTGGPTNQTTFHRSHRFRLSSLGQAPMTRNVNVNKMSVFPTLEAEDKAIRRDTGASAR